jgi:serine/threonine-protein kinase
VGEPLVIQDRYAVIRRLAIGGMGEIFLARQIAKGTSASRGGAGFSRLVILKTLRPELVEQTDALEQFLDEARVASMLSHPNIVAVYEVGVHAGVHFIAMEYIGGIDLAALLRAAGKQGKRISPRVAAAIVRDAAIGLDHAHHAKDDAGESLEIVHRDVSPQNIMIRADALVKVVDFGVAVASNQMHETQGDKLKGKIRYMSPEQLLGDELDGRSDMFSLGIVLWELVAGRPLFSGNNPIDVFQKILSGEIPPMPDAPTVLADIARKMLESKPAARYARCADAAAALRAWIDATSAGKSETVEQELQALIADLAGAQIADRVRDLTPRAVSLHGIGDSVLSGTGEVDVAAPEQTMFPAASTDAPTRILTPGGGVAAPATSQENTQVSHEDVQRALQAQSSGEGRVSVAAPSDRTDTGALLEAVELSGVVHGERSYVTVLVGLLPGWSALVPQIANVPMGAFGVNRLKNLFLRQLESVAKEQRGVVVHRGPDSFVIAFGLKAPLPGDAQSALACAFATQKLLDDLAKDPSQRLTAHVGVAGGTAIVSDAEAGPVRLAGSVVERAEALATRARELKRGVLVSSAVGELARGSVGLVAIEGEDAFEATGVSTVSSSVVRKKILIADDAVVFRRIEEEILRPFSYSFLHAKDGAQAVKLAVEEKPDLVLLDIQMPVLDGVQVLQFLKKNDATKHIPVVIVTTIGREHDEDLMRRGGADAFLRKPVQPGVLISTVRKLLG